MGEQGEPEGQHRPRINLYLFLIPIIDIFVGSLYAAARSVRDPVFDAIFLGVLWPGVELVGSLVLLPKVLLAILWHDKSTVDYLFLLAGVAVIVQMIYLFQGIVRRKNTLIAFALVLFSVEWLLIVYESVNSPPTFNIWATGG